MRAKPFALVLITLAAGLFAGTVFANLVIDPQEVFATGFFPHPPNANTRYLHYLAYRREASQVDALLFASSRGGAFDRDLLARRMGAHLVADFGFPFGLLSDYLPFLEYVVRDKASRQERVRAVLLVIDVDHFGKAPWTNVNIDSMLPPAVSGEGALSFWWRYLTAFQYHNWRLTLRRRVAVEAAIPASAHPQGAQPIPVRGWEPQAGSARPRGAQPIPPRPDFRQQLALLRRFSRVCRDHDIALMVATSPLSLPNAKGLDAAELRAVIGEIANVVPVWDFSAPSALSVRADLWLDQSHFGQAIGAMMLDRMYLGRGDPDFGRLLGPYQSW